MSRKTWRIMMGAGVGLLLGGGILFGEEQASTLNEGSLAPDFTVTLASGDTLHLGAFKGKYNVVLFFYPRDFRGGLHEAGLIIP